VIEPGVSRTGNPSGSRTVAMVIGPFGPGCSARRGGPPRPSAARRLSVASTSTKNDGRKHPVLGGAGGAPAGTSPSNTASSRTPGVVVRNPRITQEDRPQPATGGVEQARPVALDVSVLQRVQAEPVPVEAQAGVEVADDQHGVVNGGTHSASSLAAAGGRHGPAPRRCGLPGARAATGAPLPVADQGAW